MYNKLNKVEKEKYMINIYTNWEKYGIKHVKYFMSS